ncbi:MAG: hypothetical protein ACFHWZ_12840 [Phycisphaerales bacterium]|nr:hypothetical protein [bacterium]
MVRLNRKDTNQPPPRSLRRGLVHGEALVVLVAGAVLTAASFIFVPTAIRAVTTSETPPDVPPRSVARLTAFEAIKTLLSSCQEVVAIHASSDAGVTELVLWYRDVDLDRAMDPSELLVLTHSRFLGQLTASSVEWQPSPGDASFDRLTRPIDRSRAAAPSFPSQWRERKDVAVAAIAVGVDGFRLDDLGGKFGQDAYRVTLLWSTDVSDAIEEGPSSFVFTAGAKP